MSKIKNISEILPLRFEEVNSTSEFVEYLRKCYWNAKQFENTLPYLIENITSYELSLALSDAISISVRHTNRLIQIFDSIQERVKGERCSILYDQFTQLQEIASKFPVGLSLDNAIILQCQKIMSHDIKVMSSLLDFAKINKDTTVSHFLNSAISEEKDAHAILTEIALQSIYFEQAV